MRQSPGERDLTIVANQFAFQPARIVVNAGDVVKITLIAEDRPHSFRVDAYRISRRATPGHSAVIEFCGDRVGTSSTAT